jgi:hypothetical protein
MAQPAWENWNGGPNSTKSHTDSLQLHPKTPWIARSTATIVPFGIRRDQESNFQDGAPEHLPALRSAGSSNFLTFHCLRNQTYYPFAISLLCCHPDVSLTLSSNLYQRLPTARARPATPTVNNDSVNKFAFPRAPREFEVQPSSFRLKCPKSKARRHAEKCFLDYFSTSDLELSSGELEERPELNNTS